MQDVEKQLTTFAQDKIKEDIAYNIHVAEGKPYSTIIEHAKRLGVDLIIMPSHKRSKIDKVMLGSVTSKVSTLLKYTLLTNSSFHVLSLWPNHLRVLLFTHSTTPHPTPLPRPLMPHLSYTLLNPSHILTPHAPLK